MSVARERVTEVHHWAGYHCGHVSEITLIEFMLSPMKTVYREGGCEMESATEAEYLNIEMDDGREIGLQTVVDLLR